jgi:NAD(P)-dependent dehydrogenase (short-subunit alcohol dehydrogenase family)
MTELFSYSGKRVVVTGAASGMGRATTAILLDQGAEVHAVDLNPVDLDTASFSVVNLCDRSAIDDYVSSLSGRFDALFNVAGGVKVGSDPIDMARLNFLGLRHLTEALIPMIAEGGAISNVSSKAGLYWPLHLPAMLEVVAITDDDDAEKWFAAHPDHLTYNWVKGCVMVYTMARSAELVGYGIRMNAVAPGATDTNFFIQPMSEEQLRLSTGQWGAMATSEEMAWPLLYLASPAASYVSGANLVVDAAALAGYITGRLEPPPVPTYQRIREPWGIGF